jgi:hypothetical protein
MVTGLPKQLAALWDADAADAGHATAATRADAVTIRMKTRLIDIARRVPITQHLPV